MSSSTRDYTQSSVLSFKGRNLRSHWRGGARKRINQKGSEPGSAFKLETGWWVDAVSVFLKTGLWVHVLEKEEGGNCTLDLGRLDPTNGNSTGDPLVSQELLCRDQDQGPPMGAYWR
jgi:hypothetical protein